MNVLFPHIFICWVLILGLSSASSVLSSYDDDDDRVITIDETGVNSIDCCVHGKCYCSNLRLALEHIQGNTKVKILSNISTHDVLQFKSTDNTNIMIIGYSNPTIRCDKQGGLIGKNIGYIVVQGVTWDSCDQGIDIEDFISVHIVECNFRNVLSVNPALSLRGHGSVYINDSVFININSQGVYFTIDGRVSATSSITLHNSIFNNATFATVIVIDTYSKLQYNVQPQVTISDCQFSKNDNYSVFCTGTDYVLPTLAILSSSFIDNLNCAIQTERCPITLYQNCSFINNSASAISISYGTINMIGPVLFYSNVINSVIGKMSYGGAVSLFNSTMFVDKGPIKFYNNVADNGGAVYIAKNSSAHTDISDVEFYNNSARYYGGAVYIESTTCDNKTLIPFYNYLFVYAHYAHSNTARLGGNFMHLYTYDDSTCSSSEPSLYSIPYKKESLFTTQPCHIAFKQEGEVLGNLTDKTTIEFWLHDVHFDLIVTDCLNNLYGPVQVFICCDAYTCDERYEYTVDCTHNNATLISNDTVVSCTIPETHTAKLFAFVSDYNLSLTSISKQIAVKMLLSDGVLENCKKYIAYVQFFAKTSSTEECEFLQCNLTLIPKGIDCVSDRYNSYFTVIPGYWYSNGFTKYVENCPQGHCDSRFNLFLRIYNNASYPNSSDQCIGEWTGLACGDCGKDNYIIHDSTNCVHSCQCYFKEFYGWLAFFLVSPFYWIIVISLIFVLLHFKFDITAGYAYGIIFYYSILEQTVNASYDGTHVNLQDSIITTCLAILSSIGNMKPPFRLLKLCFNKGTLMIDHMFLTYIHPLIVTSLIVIIFLLARNCVTVARTIGRFVNSKSICILLMLSYSSVSYTSVQLFRPLKVFNSTKCFYTWSSSEHMCFTNDLHTYLSPTQLYFHGNHKAYVIIAILCELIIGFGFPFLLLFQQYLARYFNINFTSIKPVLDQLKGCYREEYRWFAAYYLLCRQVIYAVDIGTTLGQDIKFPFMLILYALIMMIHVWFQPYKQRILNVLDSSILMTLILVYIGEHTSYGSTVIFWILPLILFINCVTFSNRLKYLVIPISCLGVSVLSGFYYYYALHKWIESTNLSNESFYSINGIIVSISSIMFLAFLIYVSKCLCVIVIRKYRRPAHRLLDEMNEDYYTNSDSDDEI